MQKAAHIRRYDAVRLELCVVFQLQVAKRTRNVGERHREYPAEAAALLGFPGIDDFQASDAREQALRGGDRRCASIVTASMDHDPAGIGSWPVVHAQAVDDKVRKFPGPLSQGNDFIEIRFAFESDSGFVEHRGGAGAGRHDDRLVPGEDSGGVAYNPSAGRPVASRVTRLAAAGLVLGKRHFAAETLQDLHGCLRNVVKKDITQAGQHELDTRSFHRGALWIHRRHL